MSPFTIRPPESTVRAYRAAGVWRDYGSIGYLRRWRDQTPQALAVSAFGPSDAPVQISYEAYAHLIGCTLRTRGAAEPRGGDPATAPVAGTGAVPGGGPVAVHGPDIRQFC